MKLRIVFRRQASEEVLEAAHRYDEKWPGLGADFVTEVDAVLKAVQRRPALYARVDGEIRRALTRRFPFAVFYVVDEDALVVLAVLNCAREPGSWRK